MCDRQERIFLLALQRLFYHYPTIANSLLDAAGSARAVFAGDRRRYRPHFLAQELLYERFLACQGTGCAERDLGVVERLGLRIIARYDAVYPPLLKEIADPPCALIVSGSVPDALMMPIVSMVGSRKASRQGLSVAASIAEGLVERGFAVASGMAYGIDSASHRGALAAGGPTIAVMGCGPDSVYPAGNQSLAEAIGKAGLMVSEFPLGEEPFRSNFPQRNRIISGLALATVIVEAAERSGSLITARFALEQNREVLSVPGLGGSIRSRGVNRLIREGAPLVESADDVAEVVEPLLSGRSFVKISGQLENDVDMHSPLLCAVPASRAATVDEIVAASSIPANRVLAELTELKLEGRVEEIAGRRWRRVRGGGCRTR